MRKSSIVLLASSALIAPTALFAAPAGASDVSITDCYKTQYGVQVRIRIRDEGATGRVRVSHPLGKGNFREPRVRSVFVGVRHEGNHGGVSLIGYGNRPSFRTTMPSSETTQVLATFKLGNGKRIHMTCTNR